MSLLPSLEIETATPVTASIIWLHGLGASGHDFEPVVPELKLPENMGLRFIFPHAPEIAVTINNGYVMPAWYDILEMTLDRKVDVAQLKASANAVHQLIDREIERDIDSERIILAGFSQGGAVSYEAALSYPQKLGGLLAMSTYFATSDSCKTHDANQQLPIYIYHGTQDPVVPETLGLKAHQTLNEMGFSPDYSSYPMEHSLCLEQIQDVSRDLITLLG